MVTTEQMQGSYKANLEMFLGLTNKVFEGVEKVAELNLAMGKAALKDAADNAKAAASAKDAQELLTLQAGFFQPLAEKAVSYTRQMYDIASTYNAEYSKAYESKSTEAQEKLQEMLSNTAKNTPPGSESVVAVMQSTAAAANNAFESVQKAMKQATTVAETNFKAMTENASKVAASAKKNKVA